MPQKRFVSTVREYVGRAAAAGFTWPLPEGLDDAALYPPPDRVPHSRSISSTTARSRHQPRSSLEHRSIAKIRNQT